MYKELLVKDIVFVGSNWDKSREKAECKVEELIPQFPACETCKTSHGGRTYFGL
ncbi:hypothetical protein N752_11720 [Desulforamulus aquiferis]|nr:hypothetical protein [Desulforamulus aquiferis]RYD05024.1 hypothetical protein N752_11720 [Desulforamulus aquiferis]